MLSFLKPKEKGIEPIRCYVVVSDNEKGYNGLQTEIVFHRRPITGELCRLEIPSSRQTQYKCPRCQLPFHVGQVVLIESGNSGVMNEHTIEFITIAGTVKYTNPSRDYVDTHNPEAHGGMIHCEHASKEELQAMEDTHHDWMVAMSRHSEAKKALFRKE